MRNESNKLFMNVIREKHEQYKSAFLGILDVLSNNDQAAKLDANNLLQKTSQELSSALAEADRPNWLIQTVALTDQYARQNPDPKTIQTGSNPQLLKKLIPIQQHALAHTWNFEEDIGASGHDFDGVFEELRDKSNLLDLFNSMIGALEEIVVSGEIDSLRAIQALKELIGTLSKNRKGSYLSTVSSWQFARTFTKNLVWESLAIIPGIKQAKAAYEKSLKEMDVEMPELHSQMVSELNRRFKISPASLSFDSDSLLVEDDMKIHD